MHDRRSFLSQLLSTAAAVAAAAGALLAPRFARAIPLPPKVYPEYGIRRPDPKKKPDKKKPRPTGKYGGPAPRNKTE